jgi:hypothetical protein
VVVRQEGEGHFQCDQEGCNWECHGTRTAAYQHTTRTHCSRVKIQKAKPFERPRATQEELKARRKARDAERRRHQKVMVRGAWGSGRAKGGRGGGGKGRDVFIIVS